MGLDDKIRHEAEEVVGKAKEAVGHATGNERLEAEGRAEQTEANVKQAGDHVRDAAQDAQGRVERLTHGTPDPVAESSRRDPASSAQASVRRSRRGSSRRGPTSRRD